MIDMRYNSKGFTLIELMIVIAILGILAAFAVPWFQRYAVKTQVNRIMYEAGQLRASIEYCLNNGYTILGSGANLCNPGANPSDLLLASLGNSGYDRLGVVQLATPVITSPLTIGTTITATFGNNASTAISGQTLTWSRDSNGSWSCATTIAAQYRPSGC